MENGEGYLRFAQNFLWGWFLILLILGTGVLLTVRTRGVQINHLGLAFKFILKKETSGSGEVSSFAALCTALSATIGTGNIVGVATAVSSGGPGALFWMLIAAFFGMATKYAEGLLAVKYRVKGESGFSGGPFYYIENGMGRRFRWLAKLFAFFGATAGLLGIGTVTQANSITNSIENFFDSDKSNVLVSLGNHNYTLSTVIGGAVVTLLAALVIIGGIRRIAALSSVVIPIFSLLFVFFSVLAVICNIQKLPKAAELIFKSAFNTSSIGGAAVGISVKSALKYGIGRGIFSNEAGLGSAPIAAAAAKTREPVRQGLISMTATFIDTVLLCTLSGLTIVLTDAYRPEMGLEGVEITAYAWETALPFSGKFTSFWLTVFLTVFAFTSILGWNYYAERCLDYLSGGNPLSLKIFRVFYIAAVFFAPYLSVSAVWQIADIVGALMAFPNLLALISLSSVVSRETASYFKRCEKRCKTLKNKLY